MLLAWWKETQKKMIIMEAKKKNVIKKEGVICYVNVAESLR